MTLRDAMSLQVRSATFVFSCLALSACGSGSDANDDGNGGASGAGGASAGASGGGRAGTGGGASGNAGSGGSGGSVAGSGGSAGSASGAGGSAGSGGSAGTAGSAGTGGVPLPPLSPWGIDARPVNATCVAPARPTGKMGDPFPKTLKATGCVDRGDPSKMATGVIPYTVRSPLWSDAAEKHRYLALPAGSKIAIATDGHWTLPVGTVLIKSFGYEGKVFETRLMVHHSDGDWAGYTYKWRADRSDADFYDAPGSPEALPGSDRLWNFPTREQCLACHTKAAGRTLGPETAQLNGDFVYPSTGKRANQIATFAHMGLFDRDPGDPTKLPALPVPTEPSSGALEGRARSYFQANCAHCHRPGGLDDQSAQNRVALDLRYGTPLAMTRTCDVRPEKNDYGDPDARLIKPGDPDGSIVSVRLHSTSSARMPAIGVLDVDAMGVAVVDEWISSLKSCP